MKLRRGDRWIPALVVAALLFVVVAVALPALAVRLVDCPPGYFYSLWRGRCVGSLEFDRGGW
jgi:hypothetical protein